MSERFFQKTRERLDLKQVIRSVIESNGNQMTIRDLIRDFKDMNGYDLPFARFGYESLLELIRDMDDSLGIQIQDKHRYELDYVVYCLPNANTKHIVDFVQRQKHAEDRHIEVLNPVLNSDTKSKWYNNPRPKIIKPFKLKPNLNPEENVIECDINVMPNIMPSLCANRRNQKTVRRAVCPLPDSRFITNDEKNNIYELMAKIPSISLFNFEVIYKMFNKKAIDFNRFGFETLEQFLSQIPDVVQLVPTSDGIKVTATQRNGTKPDALQNGSVNGMTNHLTNGLKKTNGLKQNHFISSKDLKNIYVILRKNPKGIPVHQFLDDYYKTFGKPFVSDYWGYGSPIEMFANLRDIFYLEKPENKCPNMENYILHESTPELRAQTQKPLLIRKKFDPQFIENINQLMQKLHKNIRNKELSFDEFVDAYYLWFDQKIDPKVYGFNNLKQMLICLSKECDFDIKERLKFKPFIVYFKRSLK